MMMIPFLTLDVTVGIAVYTPYARRCQFMPLHASPSTIRELLGEQVSQTMIIKPCINLQPTKLPLNPGGFRTCLHAIPLFPSRRGKVTPALLIIFALIVVTTVFLVLALKPASTPSQANGADSNLGQASNNAATAPSAASNSQRVDAVLNAAITLIRDSKYSQAQAVLIQAAQEFPNEQRVQQELGNVYLAQQQVDSAYIAYNKALQIGPASAALELMAGSAANMSNRLEEAEGHFLAAQKGDPSDFKATIFLAQVQIKREKHDAAKANLLIASKLKSEAALPWGNLAEIALRENKLELAKQHIAKARELDPVANIWRIIQARILKRDNKPQEALEILIGLPEEEQFEPFILETMLQCYGMLTRTGDAAKLAVRASNASPARGDLAMQAAQWSERAGDLQRAHEMANRGQECGEPGADELIKRLTQPK